MTVSPRSLDMIQSAMINKWFAPAVILAIGGLLFSTGVWVGRSEGAVDLSRLEERVRVEVAAIHYQQERILRQIDRLIEAK